MQIHFVLILAVLLGAAAIHAALTRRRNPAQIAELGLLYLLVGYCGVPMLAVSLWLLVSPEQATHAFGFAASGPVVAFFAWAYLGMSLLSLLALWYRGTYLVGPAAVWAVYLGGATLVHLDPAAGGMHGHGGALEIFAAHGLIAVLLATTSVVSGVWKRKA